MLDLYRAWSPIGTGGVRAEGSEMNRLPLAFGVSSSSYLKRFFRTTYRASISGFRKPCHAPFCKKRFGWYPANSAEVQHPHWLCILSVLHTSAALATSNKYVVVQCCLTCRAAERALVCATHHLLASVSDPLGAGSIANGCTGLRGRHIL